jgi:Mn2+/Fe2+ NRAMP family transporter
MHLNSLIRRFGPGLFIMGYVIGTGSITSMVVAGAGHGLSLLLPLLLSCIATGVLLLVISRLTIFSGETLLYNIRVHLHPLWSLALLVGLSISVIGSVIGVSGVVADALHSWTQARLPAPWAAALVLGGLLLLYWQGKHTRFLQLMAALVGLMSVAFLIAAVSVAGEVPTEALQMRWVDDPLTLSGMVGTTMAAVVLVSRSMLVQEAGRGPNDLGQDRRDTVIAMSLTFLVSGAIMWVAAATLFGQGQSVERAVDMAFTLERIAGPAAMSFFFLGILAAGTSSLFPNLLLIPWLWSDYHHQPRDMRRTGFRVLVVLVAATGLIGPILGSKPVVVMMLSQAISPLIMPLLTLALIVLSRNKDLFGPPHWGWPLALVATFLFTLFMAVISYQGIFQ